MGIIKRAEIIGYSEDGKTPVIDGGYIAFMMDTYGLGVAEYAVMLRECGLGFSMSGFVEGGLELGWDPQQIVNKLLDNAPSGVTEEMVKWLVVRACKRRNEGAE